MQKRQRARQIRRLDLTNVELASSGTPLIGFSGAPFTLASYAIEGGGSRNYARTKALMYGEPAAWRRLMSRLVAVLADFLLAQARAGGERQGTAPERPEESRRQVARRGFSYTGSGPAASHA